MLGAVLKAPAEFAGPADGPVDENPEFGPPDDARGEPPPRPVATGEGNPRPAGVVVAAPTGPRLA